MVRSIDEPQLSDTYIYLRGDKIFCDDKITTCSFVSPESAAVYVEQVQAALTAFNKYLMKGAKSCRRKKS
jgi:hypothetical protein